MINRRDDLRKRDPTSPELLRLNKAIQNRICVHKRKKWRDFVEAIDQKTDLTKLWRTIKGIDGRAKREAENEAITFNGIPLSSSMQLATKFNQQFNTSKLGIHTSSRETRVVTRETKRKPLEMVRTFTNDIVMKAIKSCRNSKAFGHNLSYSGYMEVIIIHPYTETGQCHIPRNFLPANLFNLHSSKSPGISIFTNNQQISHPCSRPTRFQTCTLDHLGSVTVTNRRCSWIQSEEAPRSNRLHCCRFIGSV